MTKQKKTPNGLIFSILSRLRMAVSVLTQKGWGQGINYPITAIFGNHYEFIGHEDEVDEHFGDILDSQSRQIMKNYLRDVSFNMIKRYEENFFFRNTTCQLTKTEKAHLEQCAKDAERMDIPFYEASSLYFHHGLRDLPPAVLDYIRDKDFIDAGACYGESTLVMFPYKPRKVYAFEPSSSNASVFHRVMKHNAAEPACFELIQAGITSSTGTLNTVDSGGMGYNLLGEGTHPVPMVCLDDFVREKGLIPGFVKADIEGFGLEMIEGSLDMIRTHMPVLAISIYHNRKEFFGILDRLKKESLEYHYEVRKMSFGDSTHETTLMAYPSSLYSQKNRTSGADGTIHPQT